MLLHKVMERTVVTKSTDFPFKAYLLHRAINSIVYHNTFSAHKYLNSSPPYLNYKNNISFQSIYDS